MTPPDNHTHDFTSHPFIKIVHRYQTAAPLKGFAEGWFGLDPLGIGVNVGEADLEVLGPVRHQPPAQHVEAALAGLGVVADAGRESVGATFQLGGKFGVGRWGGIEKTSLISLTSEERRTRPHMIRT
jgi:hypothetical protein